MSKNPEACRNEVGIMCPLIETGLIDQPKTWGWKGRALRPLPLAPILTCLYFDISKGVIIHKNSVRDPLIDLSHDSCNFFQIPCIFFWFF